jgi:hypothetical protein
MQSLTFDHINYEADNFLDGYEIHKKPSSNIDFFGFEGNTLFVQFTNGSCWLYYITDDLKNEILNPGPGPDGKPLTVGKIVANKVVRKVASQSVYNNMIKILPRPTALLKSEVKTDGNVLKGVAHEEVYIVVDKFSAIVENMRTGDRYQTAGNNLLRKSN